MIVFALVAVTAAAPDGLPADPPFDKYVAPQPLAVALARLTPADLLFAADGLVAGEKALGRPRAGVPARVVLKLAVNAAVARRDAASLTRAEALAKAAGLADVALAAALGKAAARGGKTDPAIMAALDKMDPDEFAAFQAFQSQIHSARTLGDRAALAALQAKSRGLGLEPKLKTYLAKAATDSLAALPPADEAADPDVKLAADLHRKGKQDTVAISTPVSPDAAKDFEPKKDDPPAAADAPKEPAADLKPTRLPEILAALGKDPAAVIDDGFDGGRFNLAKVGVAWGKGNAAGLADQAFFLAAEEKEIGRPHRHLPAKALLQAAIGLAIASGDAETLNRIEKKLKDADDKAPLTPADRGPLTAQLAAARPLMLASRKGTPPIVVPLDRVTPEGFAAFRYLLDRVKAARATGDADALAGVEAGLELIPELGPEPKAYLAQMVADARAAAPAEDVPGADLLRQLGAAGRATAGTIPERVLAFANGQLGKKVGDGTAAAFVKAALTAAGGGLGAAVQPVNVKPGDVVRYPVYGTVVYPGGGRDPILPPPMPDFVGVVIQATGQGRFLVLTQQAGGQLGGLSPKVVTTTVDLGRVKPGVTVTFARPTAGFKFP